MPSSTPAGMFTDSVRSRVTRPEPVQDGHGSSITWPRPWQPGQVRSSVKKPCAWRMRPAPLQCGQVFGLEPVLAPVPEQDSQATDVGSRTWAVLPLIRLLEADLHVVAEVGAALAAVAAAAGAAHAEDALEQVGEGGAEVRAEAVAAARALLERGVAEAVIGRALVRVLEDLVGLVDLLEAVLAVLVAGIAVRVPLHGKLAERGLELAVLDGCARPPAPRSSTASPSPRSTPLLQRLHRLASSKPVTVACAKNHPPELAPGWVKSA